MKNLKRIILISLFVFVFFNPLIVKASNDMIYSIDTIVDLQDDGTANITQIWDIQTNSGTEFYIPMTNLNKMKLENFSVVDEEGVEFDFQSDWDLNASLEQKAHKCGINKIDDGFELCWGKGSYGRHIYTLTWEYKNVVQAYNDFDGFNIRLVNDNMDPVPKSISAVIKKDGFDLSNKNSRIWAFGYKGEINFTDDGMIEALSEDNLNKYNYMNIMVRFDKGIFDPIIENDYSFDEVEDLAKQESSYENEEISLGKGLKSIVIIAIPFVFIWLIAKKISKSGFEIPYEKAGIKLDLFPNNYKKILSKDVDYCRKIPLENNLDMMHYISNLNWYSITIKRDIISAYLLYWIKNRNIEIIERIKYDIINPEKDKKILTFKMMDSPNFKSDPERALWTMMIISAGEDKILDEGEFSRYVIRNLEQYRIWFGDSIRSGGARFLDIGGIEPIKKSKKSKTNITQNGILLVKEFVGFKKYLDDFTLINEREVKEVELWDDYLIIATVLGLGEKVADQMKKLVPNYVFAKPIYEEKGDIYDIQSIVTLTNSFGETASYAYRSIFSSSSSSDGGGGSSSYSGGGGYSGGGSGGGSR
ncbi:MAG: DUF2207 domain-containing protein [Tissierellia bacterium]|nr:DUF2207 domain-containing protein [Tissierellia bacterium]